MSVAASDAPVGWGFWGCGLVAAQVAQDAGRVPAARLIAAAARREPAAAAFATQHGFKRSHGGLAALLRDPEVQAVYIATPHHRHVEDALQCIDAGKAVLCEKPFTLNAAQARRIFDAAQARSVFCMEAMWTRFVPAVQALKRRMAAGELGQIHLIEGNFAYPVSDASAHRLFSLDHGGGALLDRGVYLMSLAHYLLGVPYSVQGSARMSPGGVDETSSMLLTWPGGTSGVLWSSIVLQGSNQLTVHGSRASLTLQAPFYRSEALTCRALPLPMPALALPATPPSTPPAPGALARLKGQLSQSGRARRGLRLLRSLRTDGQTQALAFDGHGYRFEIAEASRCVAEGLLQSPVMPWAGTLEVLASMDALRAQWGLVYPDETGTR